MRRLGNVDSTFLFMETPTMPMHVIGVLLLDPKSSPIPEGDVFPRVKEMLASRIHLMPPFRQRLVDVPFGLDHPLFINDANFDLENHLRHVSLPPPGDRKALGDIVGEIAGRSLDRRYPLWEMWVIEGLDDGNVAIVTKMHHSTIDGVSGADLMVHMFDLSPEVRPVDPPSEAFEAEQPPSDLSLLGRGLVHQATSPVRLVKQVGKSAGNLVDVVRRTVLRRDGEGASLPGLAPRTTFSGALTPHRSVAFSRVALADLKAIKDAFGGKVNDVVLAMTTSALRDYLILRNDLPAKPLIAACPISVRTEATKDQTNQISSMLVPLPVQSDDPVEQLELIIATTAKAKELANAIGAETLQDWAGFMAPRLFTLAMRAYSSLKLGDLHPPFQNLIVSNVPGPPLPLYTAGARLEAIYPMGPLLPGAGINVTVLSNMGNVDIGIIACRELVPGLWDIADAMPRAIETLLSAARRR